MDKTLKTVLTIAGSDSSGGAGIQADLKTMIANGVYGMSAITSLTAQNTQGVTAILDSTPEFLAAQLDAVFTDIFPDAVKIGMVSSAALIEIIGDRLKHYKVRKVVVDPVMVATSGAKLINDDAVNKLTSTLFPLATVITPNMFELAALTNKSPEDIKMKSDMEEAAKILYDKYGCAILAKGGHFQNSSPDLLCNEEGFKWFYAERVATENTHGTGCTLSSAIASNLAKGMTLEEAIHKAKLYLIGALSSGLNLGHGNGPLDHGYKINMTLAIDHFV